MIRQRTSRRNAAQRHYKALLDLAASPGMYKQSEWVAKHCIGNRSCTSAIRLGIITRKDGKLYCNDRVTMATVKTIMDKNIMDKNAELAQRQVVNAPSKPNYGIIRRFLRWMW